MSEQVTMENPEIKAIFEQILKDAETCKKRQQLSEASLKSFFTALLEKFGYGFGLASGLVIETLLKLFK